VLTFATETRDNFVSIDVGVAAWVALGVIIAVMLAIDLIRHREAHAPTGREALVETATWIACGIAFSVVIAVAYGGDAFGEYISGYLIEKSLSVDNVFVWAVLFSSMSIPVRYQHRVLFWGIFGALALRAVFILIGAALIDRFSWLLVVFGVFLVFTGLRIIRHKDDEGDRTSTAGLGLLRKVMPVSDELDGQKFFSMVNGKRVATPLLGAVVVIEFTDLVFALDSVPAILAVSKEPYIVFASNAFAILGLRAMYFLLANAKERFHYLSHALGGILVFVGMKMAISQRYHLDTFVSLGVIVAMLILAMIASEIWARRRAIIAPSRSGQR
jgi:tellurite resistance protein TerC